LLTTGLISDHTGSGQSTTNLRRRSSAVATTTMPLVKLFAKTTLTKKIPLAPLQAKLCEIWGTKPETTKLMLFRCEDWTDESFSEDVYVDIRAYGELVAYTSGARIWKICYIKLQI